MSPKKIVAEINAAASASARAAVVAATGKAAPPRLIDKAEVLRRVPFTYPTLWAWMREDPPAFPRSRDTGGKITWVESEIDNWILNRPQKVLKGDKAARSTS
jgi:predicted DNA-binding transcriptional regulator AlpA